MLNARVANTLTFSVTVRFWLCVPNIRMAGWFTIRGGVHLEVGHGIFGVWTAFDLFQQQASVISSEVEVPFFPVHWIDMSFVSRLEFDRDVFIIPTISQRSWCIFYTELQLSRTVPLAWCRSYHWFAIAMWEVIVLSLNVSVRQNCTFFVRTVDQNLSPALMLICFIAAIARHKHRSQVATFLYLLTAIEFVVCTYWGILLGQQTELLGACLIKSMPDEVVYLLYASYPPSPPPLFI